MPITARSTPNIALIKYWGNRNDGLRLPAADSLSMALNTPSVEIIVDDSAVLDIHSFESDGRERTMTMKHVLRFNRHLELTKQYLAELGSPEAIPASVSITIHSAIPPGIGIASSAAVFSCLAQAYAGLIEMERKLSQEEISVIGRLGSGSAARSAFDGYVALEAGTGDAIDSAKAVPIADDQHWLLYDIIIVPSRKEKEYGSTEGHSLARTSPLFSKRVQEIPRRQRECIDAIHKRDFEKLQHVAEEDCLDMHEVMRTSTPSLQYLTRDTRLILEEITVYRRMKRLPVLYTMDAGPTVHLFCPAEAKEDVLHFAHEQQGCTVFVAHTGKGAHLLKKSS